MTENVTSFSFRENSKFIRIDKKHLGGKESIQGVYKISGDTLILTYEGGYPDRANITDQRKISPIGNKKAQLALLDIRIVGEDKKPLSGVNMTLQHTDGGQLLTFISDSLGGFQTLSIHSKLIGKITFSFLGCQDYHLLTERFFGYSTSLILTMSNQSFIEPNTSIEKYIIKAIDDTEVRISPIGIDTVIILRRN